MSVAEHGEALGFEFMGQRRGSSDVVHGLIWQAVHKIDINLVYANFAQSVDCLLNNRKWLDAPDCLLHMRRKILNTEARPGHANVGKRARERFCDISRIKLERMLAQCRKVKTNVELRNELAQPLRADNGGSSPTPMEMNDPPASHAIGEQVDFPE